MKLELRNNRDLWAGLLLIAIGAGAMAIARNYPLGTALRMGPGYFPVVLGGLLVAFGLYLLGSGLRAGAAIESPWPLRALVILPASLVLFGLLIERTGFIPALIVLIVGSAAAGTQFRLAEVLLLAIGLTALSVLVFVWALGLPYPLLASFD
jgi:hypothetical protein